MKNVIIITSALSLSGCASILSGTEQQINLATPKHKNAKCRITNDQGEWFCNNTPEIIKVKRSKENLIVTCEKEDLIGESSVKPSFNSATLANVLAGGVIGLAIDYGSDAAYEYPSNIEIMLSKKEG